MLEKLFEGRDAGGRSIHGLAEDILLFKQLGWVVDEILAVGICVWCL